jgi:hypothetical protein
VLKGRFGVIRKLGVLILCISLPLIIFTACDRSGLNLEKAKEHLNQDGYVFVDTIKTASQLAGYPLQTPSYLPEDFKLTVFRDGAYQVFTLATPEIPTENKTTEFPYSVVQFFYKDGNIGPNEPFFDIHQSRNKINGPGNDPITINGFEGKKGVFNDNLRPMLYITWSDGTIYFVLEGWLADTLDEAELIKVASSMKE